jgi:hypothetical protein
LPTFQHEFPSFQQQWAEQQHLLLTGQQHPEQSPEVEFIQSVWSWYFKYLKEPGLYNPDVEELMRGSKTASWLAQQWGVDDHWRNEVFKRLSAAVDASHKILIDLSDKVGHHQDKQAEDKAYTDQYELWLDGHQHGQQGEGGLNGVLPALKQMHYELSTLEGAGLRS